MSVNLVEWENPEIQKSIEIECHDEVFPTILDWLLGWGWSYPNPTEMTESQSTQGGIAVPKFLTASSEEAGQLMIQLSIQLCSKHQSNPYILI